MASDQSDSIPWRRPQPSFTESNNEIVAGQLESTDRATPASPNLVLLTKLVQTIRKRGITEFTFDPDRRSSLGEGATYEVSRATVRSFWEVFWGKAKDYQAAVKTAKLNVGRTFVDIGMNEAERRRLKVVLFELDVLSRPAIREHPNIASLMGFSWDETDFGYAPCLIMELATMGTARDFISTNQTLSDLGKLTLCRDVACGLHFLHAYGIVHGDVKQDNVLIYADNSAPAGFVAKLSDLERCPQNSESLTYTGTTLYNAPEVRDSGRGRLDPDFLWYCDVFSFGLLSFEVLSGLSWKHVWEQGSKPSPNTGKTLHIIFTLGTLPRLTCYVYAEHAVEDKTLDLARRSVNEDRQISDKLRYICQSILTVTLGDEPLQRIPLGWGMVLDILLHNE